MRNTSQSIKSSECPLPVMKSLTTLTVITAGLILRGLAEHASSCESPHAKCRSVVALIPARAGSKGIKDKNLSVLGNETLITRTVRIAREAGEFHSIWVSTDGENIRDEAVKHGAKVHSRNPQTATDNATTVSVVVDFLLKQKGYDIVAVLQCTSPFLKKEYLIRALNLMMTTDVDCVFSVTRTFQLRWAEHADGFVSPINFNSSKRPRRQDWAGELVENGMFYIVKTELVLRDKVLQNNRCKIIEIPKEHSIEIDTVNDLLLARAMLPLLESEGKNNISV